MRKLTPDMCRPFSVDIFMKRLAGKPVVNDWTEEVERLRELVAALTAERDLLKKHQSVCECGGYSKDHNLSDHQVSDMPSPCPYKEQAEVLKAEITRLLARAQKSLRNEYSY